MGGAVSSESHGTGCSGCGIILPPANPTFDFVKACDNFAHMRTYCFWQENEGATTISETISFEVSGSSGWSVGGSRNVSVRQGERLFKYFRNEGSGDYFCSKCWVERFPKRAQSVMLELAGKGLVLSKEFQLVKVGGRI